MSDYDLKYVPNKQYFLVGGKAIVLNKDGKILALQRSDKSGGGGKWSIPGGGLEANENPTEAIKREIMEETKLEVEEVKPFSFKSYSHDGNSILMIGFICRVAAEEVTLNWEHNDYQWLTKDEALKLDLTEDGKYFIEKFNYTKN